LLRVDVAAQQKRPINGQRRTREDVRPVAQSRVFEQRRTGRVEALPQGLAEDQAVRPLHRQLAEE
jgi:hypothetical protein